MNRKLYCFWFGDEMSQDRKYCFDSMVANAGVEVVLVTKYNLSNFVRRPLYKGFEYLSHTHKSAYLRSYFMMTYGGCYADIKYLDYDLNPYFDLLESSDKDMLGYKEAVFGEWCNSWPNLGRLCGCGMYIFKPNTLLANVWYKRITIHLNKIYDQLRQNPGTYHPRAVTGGICGPDYKYQPEKYGNYPLGWDTFWGATLQRTQLDHIDRVMTGLPFTFPGDPNFVKYR
jgi:hypothetical protein